MTTRTPNHGWVLPVPNETEDWGTVLNDFFEGELDQEVILYGLLSDRPDPGPDVPTLYFVTDEQRFDYNDGTEWQTDATAGSHTHDGDTLGTLAGLAMGGEITMSQNAIDFDGAQLEHTDAGYWYTDGSGSDSLYIWDSDGDTAIARFDEGGTVTFPDSSLTLTDLLLEAQAPSLTLNSTDTGGSDSIIEFQEAGSVAAQIFHDDSTNTLAILNGHTGLRTLEFESTGDITAGGSTTLWDDANGHVPAGAVEGGESVVDTGNVQLSSGEAAISTGITSGGVDLDVRLDPSGRGNNSVKVGASSRVNWRGDLSTPEYEVEILEDGTSVGNPYVGYTIVRS